MKTPLILLALSYSLLAQEKPNILFITSEDNSAHWLGCYGNKQAHTPNIDALANEGILFENAYSNAPVCAVARATILMGAYSPTMGRIPKLLFSAIGQRKGFQTPSPHYTYPALPGHKSPPFRCVPFR